MTITPELAEIIADAIEDRLIDLHTSLPGVIQTYDTLTQTATVELQLDRLLENADGTLVSEALPVIQNVNVIFPRTLKFFKSFPIEPGDTGDVIFSEASIGQWRASDGVSAPDDTGRHTLSGAKFYPGLNKDSAALTDDLTLGALFGHIGGATLLIKENDTILLDNKTGTIELTGDTTTVNSGTDWAVQYTALKSAFDELKGDFNALVTKYNAHIHVTTATVGAGPAVGVISPTTSTESPSTADMSGAKVDEVKLP